MADLYALFAELSAHSAELAAARFEQGEATKGDVLATEGEVNDAMLLIEEGHVVIIAGGFEVARMGPGSIIGEIGLFTHAIRTATVRADGPVIYHRLSRRAFAQLREMRHPVAFRIERRAADQLGARMRQLVQDVVGLAVSRPSMQLPPRTRPETSGAPVPLSPARVQHGLAGSIPFQGAPADVLEAIAARIEARTFVEGDTITADGRADGPMFVLAHGQVDLLAPVGNDHQVRVATLAPGALFNTLHYLDEQPRPISAIAASGVTALAIPRDQARSLLRAYDLGGSTFRIALIRALSEQVNHANGTFAMGKLVG